MSRLKKIGLIIFILVILLLDFAALDDITTGNEPTLFGEYAMLAASVVIFAVLIFIYLRKKK